MGGGSKVSSVHISSTSNMSPTLGNAVRSRSKLGEDRRQAEMTQELESAQEQEDAKQAAWFCQLASLSKSFGDLNALLEVHSKQSSGHLGRKKSGKTATSRSASSLAFVEEAP